jgi:hypothetical protein
LAPHARGNSANTRRIVVALPEEAHMLGLA